MQHEMTHWSRHHNVYNFLFLYIDMCHTVCSLRFFLTTVYVYQTWYRTQMYYIWLKTGCVFWVGGHAYAFIFLMIDSDDNRSYLWAQKSVADTFLQVC